VPLRCCCPLPRFEAIEIDNARTAMTRIDYSVHQTLSELLVSAADWGNWTDTYQSIVDHNARYQHANLGESSIKQLHLATLACIDLNGSVVLSKSLDPDTGELLPQDLLAHGSLPQDFPWLDNLRIGRTQRIRHLTE